LAEEEAGARRAADGDRLEADGANLRGRAEQEVAADEVEAGLSTDLDALERASGVRADIEAGPVEGRRNRDHHDGRRGRNDDLDVGGRRCSRHHHGAGDTGDKSLELHFDLAGAEWRQHAWRSCRPRSSLLWRKAYRSCIATGG